MDTPDSECFWQAHDHTTHRASTLLTATAAFLLTHDTNGEQSDADPVGRHISALQQARHAGDIGTLHDICWQLICDAGTATQPPAMHAAVSQLAEALAEAEHPHPCLLGRRDCRCPPTR